MSMHNVDNILHTKHQEEPSIEVVEKSPPQETSNIEEDNDKPLNYLEQFRKDKEETLSAKDDPKAKEVETNKAVEKEEDADQQDVSKTSKNKESVKTAAKEPEHEDSDTDDYGTPIPKKQSKMYSEEDVQRMIRERLARTKQPEQPQVHPQEQIAKAAQNFEADPNSEESWEIQLSNFIREEVSKMTRESQQRAVQAEIQKQQAEFEARFSQGMSKYDDFVEVVGTKPITNDMVLASRSMKDPAAFLYAASKLHPGELERISKIQDAYQVAAEIGRLEERMKKSKNVSSAPRPPSKITGDMQTKYNDSPSIDALIAQHAKRKLGRS